MSARVHRIAAALTHVLTASGAACGLLALVAAADGRVKTALLWLLLALVIDGIDGPLARRVRTAAVLPAIDGSLLDNIVDYLTYVVVPAVLVHESGLLPAGWDVIAATWICVASAIQFSHVEAKTEDGLFRGFPSCWNVVVLYLLVLRPPAAVSAPILVLLGGLALAPIYCVHPTRTPVLRRTTLALTVAWAVSVVAIVARFPDVEPWVVVPSLAYVAYYTVLSLALTRRRRLPSGL